MMPIDFWYPSFLSFKKILILERKHEGVYIIGPWYLTTSIVQKLTKPNWVRWRRGSMLWWSLLCQEHWSCIAIGSGKTPVRVTALVRNSHESQRSGYPLTDPETFIWLNEWHSLNCAFYPGHQACFLYTCTPLAYYWELTDPMKLHT